MPEEGIAETKISRYNQALGQIIRLDHLWQRFHNNVLEGKLKEANFILDRIWGELSGDAIKDNETDINKVNKKIIECITDNNKEKFYITLMEKETLLRKIQNKQGKGTAYEEDDDFE